MKTYTLNISVEVDADHIDHMNEKVNRSGLRKALADLSEYYEIDVESVIDLGEVLRNAALASQASKQQGSGN